MKLKSEHKELLLAMSNSKTLTEWYTFFNGDYTKNQIYSFCYHHHKKIKTLSENERNKIQAQNARKYAINQDYFKTWSHNMAYVLGFWFADGCIYGGRLFDITIHKKDKYLLKMIAQELAYEGQIQDYVDKQACRINFSCKEIYNDIIKLGGIENKSLNLIFPEVPKKYMPDFLRGYFDGDGSIMLLKNNRVNSAFTCGNKKFLDSLWRILKDFAQVEGGSYDPSCVSLKFGKKDTLKIGQYIYSTESNLFLKRKKDKFDNLISKER